jgi:peroxiredoxin Q/BCP
MKSNVLSIGDPAPDFTSESTDGPFTLSSRIQNGPILLYFYVMNYGRTCTDYMAKMNESKPELDEMGITLVHINPDSIENHRQWMIHTGALFEHISDEGQHISKEYGAIVERAKSPKIVGCTNREFFLIGTDMTIKYIWRAFWPNDTVPIDELMNGLRAALGCSKTSYDNH